MAFELETAGLTSEGTYVPPTLSLRHLKIPEFKLSNENLTHSSTESKNNNSNDYTEE